MTDSASPLRVAHIVYSFGLGGSETVAREVAVQLAERGHRNMVVALEHDGPLAEEFRAMGIAAHAVERADKGMVQSMLDVWRLVRTFRPDVLHTHHMYMLFYTVPAAVLTRTPIVHTEHEFWSLDTRKGRLFMPVLGRFCRWITAVNEETRRFMQDALGLQRGKLVTVLNGVDVQRFAPQSNGTGPELNRADMGLEADARVAVIVARLEPVKNHSMLLHAWRQVLDAEPRARLVVVGAGSMHDALRQEAERLNLGKAVLFTGPRRDVPALLRLADVAVLSSHDEGLPMCLLEAMATELPVVATDVGGVSGVVRNGENGLLVAPDDPAAFAAAVLELFQDTAAARRMGREGRAGVLGRYDLGAAVDRYLALYRDERAADAAQESEVRHA